MKHVFKWFAIICGVVGAIRLLQLGVDALYRMYGQRYVYTPEEDN